MEKKIIVNYVNKNAKKQGIDEYPATNWAKCASFHPFVYTSKMIIMGTFRCYFGVFKCVSCESARKFSYIKESN